MSFRTDQNLYMTTQFHEGQEVEIWGANMYPWRKAKIVSIDRHGNGYAQVQFPDGTRFVFSAEHIRKVSS